MTKTVGQDLADQIARLPGVERAVYLSASRRVVVDYPRSRGGRAYMTIPEAKRHLTKRQSERVWDDPYAQASAMSVDELFAALLPQYDDPVTDPEYHVEVRYADDCWTVDLWVEGQRDALSTTYDSTLRGALARVYVQWKEAQQ